MIPRTFPPDLILLARRCRTFARPVAGHAVAVAQGRITQIGSRARVLRTRSRQTRVIDLKDAVLSPGLVDCHTHFFYWALGRALTIDVSDRFSLEAVLTRIRQQAGKRRVGDWVIAQGFDHNRWGSVFPTAADLDRAVPNTPAMVHSRDEHSVWLNTPALRRLKITSKTPDPKGGRFLRDSRGRPTGIVQEAAIDDLPMPVRDLALRPDPRAQRTIDHALREAYRTAWALGITGVHSMDDGPSLNHLQRQRAAGMLGLRVLHAVALPDFEHARRVGLRSGFGDEWLRIGGVKIFADGALGSQTAYMFDPYPERGDFCGVPNLAGDDLRDAVRQAVEHGWAVWVHAIGDRAVHETVAAIAGARRIASLPLPHRIEHTQCIRPADLRRMAQARIVASVQPCHLLGDIATADRHWPRARRHTYVFRRLLDAGIVLAAGSDVPIESIDPRRSLFAATSRTDEHGRPAGGWFPQQRLTALEALYAFTRGAAAAAGQPLPAGTLAPGAPADLTVWDEDPLRIDPARLLDIGIRGCVIAGQPHLLDES